MTNDLTGTVQYEKFRTAMTGSPEHIIAAAFLVKLAVRSVPLLPVPTAISTPYGSIIMIWTDDTHAMSLRITDDGCKCNVSRGTSFVQAVDETTCTVKELVRHPLAVLESGIRQFQTTD